MRSYIADQSEISVSFRYPDLNDPLFPELKSITNINVDTLPEIKKVKKISGYVHSLFFHSRSNRLSSLNPITIIKEARGGKSFRCVEHSFLTVSLLWAYGIPARMVGLKTKDMETRETEAGHVIAEFWSSKFQKWIMIDVQFGIIPKYKKDFLSALKLGEKLDQGLTVEYILVSQSRFSPETDTKKYTKWIHPYLYFFDTALNLKSLANTTEQDRVSDKRLMLIPLGVVPPKVFQKTISINAIYTHSILDFYPPYQNHTKTTTD